MRFRINYRPDVYPAVHGDGGGIRSDMLAVIPDSSQIQSEAAKSSSRSERAAARADSYRYWILLLLVLAAVPRFMFAARSAPICDDGYFYLAVADALDRGAYETALWYLNVNVYPVLLVGLESLGLAMLPAAKYWGATVGVLTILPLFGWVRRVLDRKMALAACVIYAMHPEFIEISAEPIRDSTFWFLMALALYCSWRAAHERRLPMFAAAGLAVALAAHTRSEGWLLGLPMVGWSLIHFRRATGAHRLRLGLGMLLSCAMTPLLLLAFNLTILRDHPVWELGKLEHFRMAIAWLATDEFDPGASHPPAVAPVRPVARSQRELALRSRLEAAPVRMHEDFAFLGEDSRGSAPDATDYVSEYVDSIIQSLKPIPLILMLIGAIVGRGLLLKRENLILSAMLVAICLGVWIRLTTLGEINGRYFLTCFFPAAGSVGLGLVAVIAALRRLVARLVAPRLAKWPVYGLVALIGLLHVGDVMQSEHPSRLREARIGRELAEELEGRREVITLPHAARVGYYLGGELPVIILDDTPIEHLIRQSRASVAILEHEVTPDHRCANLASRLIDLGWRARDITHIPDSEHFLVLTRPPKAAKTASSPQLQRINNR